MTCPKKKKKVGGWGGIGTCVLGVGWDKYMCVLGVGWDKYMCVLGVGCDKYM